MTLEIMVNDILNTLEREIIKSADVNFQFAVKYYLSGSTKHEFEHSHFFDEFEYEPLIQQELTKLYNLVKYCEFKKLVTQLSQTVTYKLLNDKNTSYELLADLTTFVSNDYCEKLAREHKFSCHYLFIVAFKSLDSCFMVSRNSRNVSSWNMKRCKQWMNKFTTPSAEILRILNDPAEALRVNVDDNWLIDKLVSSL